MNLAILAAKAELKTEQDKIVKLEVFDSSYFLGKTFFGDDGSQNMFDYQPTLDMLEFKKKMRELILLLVGNQRGIYF